MTARVRSTFVLYAIVATAVACRDQRSPRADAQVASHAIDSATDGDLLLVEDLRIDGDEELFSVPSGFLLVERDGGMIVADLRAAKLRAYDREGRHRFDFGRRGQGPGEFAPMGRLSALSGGMVGDTVWVYDGRARRITYMDRHGALVRAVTIPDVPDRFVPDLGRAVAAYLEPLAVYRDGRILGFRRAYVSRVPEVIRSDLVVLSPDSNVVHTLMTFPPPRTETLVDPVTGTPYSRGLGGSGMRTGIAQDGSRIAFVWQRTDTIPAIVSVLALSSAGDTVFTRTIPFADGVEASPGSNDWIAETTMRDLRGANASRLVYSEPFIERIGRMIRESAPRVIAPVISILAGVDGTVALVIKLNDGRLRFMILASDGRTIGTAVSPVPPSRNYTGAVSRTHLWSKVSDEDGVPSIVRYRIVPRARE